MRQNLPKYASIEEFLSQIQLIWDNCKLYNMAGSHIYKICEKMERVYNRELAKFKNQVGMATGKRTQQKQKTQVEAKVAQVDEVDDVTAEMKRDLIQRLKKMQADGITKFAAKCQEVQAQSV